MGSAAAQRDILIINEISSDIRTPPIFPAELLAILTNLLTNAVKAAGQNGKIRAWARKSQDGDVEMTIENTGVRVRPEDGERWFVPFASGSAELDANLGQGTGLGLPITRDILAEYGGKVGFVEPSTGFETAVRVVFGD
ncbi:hypothetical protein GCM10009610_00600 [Pseudonocardia xinjiangensis]